MKALNLYWSISSVFSMHMPHSIVKAVVTFDEPLRICTEGKYEQMPKSKYKKDKLAP